MKTIFRTLCLLFALTACLSGQAQRNRASVKIDQGDITIKVGETKTLTVTYSGVQASDLMWDSYDSSIAALYGDDDKAEVTGLSVGSTMISVSSGWGQNAASDYITVTVEDNKNDITDPADLPFKPTTVSGGKLADDTHWYLMSIRSGKNIFAGDDYVECTFDEAASVNYLWAFTGSIANGFRMYNYQTNADAVLAVTPSEKDDYYVYEGAYAQMLSPAGIDMKNGTFRISHNPNGGYTFTLKDQTYAGINDHSGRGILRIWDSYANLSDNGASVVFTEVDPIDYGGTPSGEVVEVSGISLDVDRLTLNAGETYQLKATILPANATYKRLTWESNNPAVATVADGLITAKQSGTAIITVTAYGGKSAQMQLTVVNNVRTDGLCINEVQAANVDQYLDPSYNYGSWIELYNGGSSTINLRTLFLTDDMAQPAQWPLRSLDLTYADYAQVGTTYPPYEACSASIPAGGYCKVWFDHNDWRYPMMCPFKLDQDGGSLYVTDGAVAVAECTYPESVARASWARTTDGGDTWKWTSQPTPGASNATATYAAQRLDAPVPDTDSKIIQGNPIVVKVTYPAGSTLRYTLDGSTPTASNGMTSSNGTFNIMETTVLRLCAVQSGKLSSPVVTRSYIFSTYNETLPVMSLVTEEGNLTDQTYGIFTRGTNGRPGLGQGSRCNWNMDWDRPTNIEYIDKQGQMVFNQECNVANAGGWSRAHEPYSFKVKGKKQYEHINFLPYDFFTARPFQKNKTLQMRNGGNDNSGRFKDPAIQTVILSSGINIDGQAYEPIHLYHNGRYAGLINMREPNNRDIAYSHFGYDEDEVDQFEMDCDSAYVQSTGTREAFERWYDLAARSADPAVYEELKEICDVEEFINYMAVQCYLHLGDYGYNNVKGYRPRVDNGKFRMVLYDLDSASDGTSCNFSGLSSIGNQRSWNSQYEGTDGKKGTSVHGEVEFFSIFGNLLKNSPEFRKQFVDQFCLLTGSVFEPQRCAAIIDSLINNVREAASYERNLTGSSLNPESVGSSLKSNYFCTSRNTSATNQLAQFGYVKNECSGLQQTLTLSQSDSRGRLYYNGLAVPTGAFNGRIFSPVTLRAEAPAGKSFRGWKVSGIQEKEDLKTAFPMADANWYYYDQGSLDNENWTAKTYSDLSWKTGAAPLGYSRNVVMATETSRDCTTTYFRKYFNLDGSVASATLDYKVDDGFAVYVNGQEAGRYNLPEGSTYDTYTGTYAGDFFTGSISINPALLQSGSNVIAVEVHNSSATSSDIVWDASLSYMPKGSGSDEKEDEGEFVSTDPEYTLPEEGKFTIEAVYEDLTPTAPAAATCHPVKINEVSAANSVSVDDYYKKSDWLELYNTTDQDIDLTGYYLSDNVDNPTKYCIEASSLDGANILPAHGHRIVWCTKQQRKGREIHANFKLGNDDDAYVILSSPDQSWGDTLTYRIMNGDESCGRYPDGTENVFLMQLPTISASNRVTMYAESYEQSIVNPDKPDAVRLISQSNELGINYSRGQICVTNEDFLPTTLRICTVAGVEVLVADLDMAQGRAAQSTASLTPGTYVATATDAEGEKVSIKFNVK